MLIRQLARCLKSHAGEPGCLSSPSAHILYPYGECKDRDLVDRVPIDIAPLDAEIAVAAAALRARHRSLKLPDALVIATAGHLDADHLVTTDRNWPSQSKLELTTSIRQI